MWKTIVRASLWTMAAIAIGVSSWWLWTHPDYLTWEYWQSGRDGKVQSSRSEVVRNLGLLLLGLVGLAFGIWRAWLAHRNQKSIEEGQITDRFTKAVEQLGSPELAVRQGAIHALWRIAEDSPERDYARVLDVLCSFIRNKKTPEPIEGAAADVLAPPDVITILERIRERSSNLRSVEFSKRYRFSIGRKSRNGETPIPYCFKFFQQSKSYIATINLSNAYLRGVNLSGSELTGANFSNSNLVGASFEECVMTNANLDYVKADNTKFTGGNFRYSTFNNASLTHSTFVESNLDDTQFIGADFSNSFCMNASFRNADLWGSKLHKAHFSSSDLSSASLGYAELEKVYFGNTILKDTNISGIKLGDSGPMSLSNDQIKDSWAYIEEKPDELTRFNFCMPRLVLGNSWSSFGGTGYPRDAPPNGMGEDDINDYLKKNVQK